MMLFDIHYLAHFKLVCYKQILIGINMFYRNTDYYKDRRHSNGSMFTISNKNDCTYLFCTANTKQQLLLEMEQSITTIQSWCCHLNHLKEKKITNINL